MTTAFSYFGRDLVLVLGPIRFVVDVEPVERPFSLIRWRAFLEDLAAIGGHVLMVHDDYTVYAPPHRAAEALAIWQLWAGPGPCTLRDLHEQAAAAIVKIMADLPNLGELKGEPDLMRQWYGER